MPRVLISYSHDSASHKLQVLRLSDRLRREGVDCQLDQYESFPAEGWPRWMQHQIAAADYVIVVATVTYRRRVEGREEPGRGLGANWEGALITQSLYDSGGRNTKFVPVVLDRADAPHVPQFLAGSTRFELSSEDGYDALYRFLTAQPAVVKPALGSIRSLARSVGSATDDSANRPVLLDVEAVVVVWRLPRGFVLMDRLQEEESDNWATVASYGDYDGNWMGDTHYHRSYGWRDTVGAFENQCAKLYVPRGDWSYAEAALHFIVDVRDGNIHVSPDGVMSTRTPGSATLESKYAYVCAPGRIPLPIQPVEYRPLVASGALRDLIAETRHLVNDAERPKPRIVMSSCEFTEKARRIRREIRIELQRRLDSHHAAARNVDEIISRYDPNAAFPLEWLRELADAAAEAAECVEEQART